MIHHERFKSTIAGGVTEGVASIQKLMTRHLPMANSSLASTRRIGQGSLGLQSNLHATQDAHGDRIPVRGASETRGRTKWQL